MVECNAALLGPYVNGASTGLIMPVKNNSAGWNSRAQQQQQQQQWLASSMHQIQQQQLDQPGDKTSGLDNHTSESAKGFTTSNSSTCSPTSSTLNNTDQQGEQQQQQQQQKAGAAAAIDTRDPDAAVAAITAAITADIGQPLAAASCRANANCTPQLFISDLLVGRSGCLLPTAEQQLAVISGLLQQCAGDLLEIYCYYALLGGCAQVVADRMTMDLRSLGKLACDLHISQDSKSLSAVEDAFYLLSDRRPGLGLKGQLRAPSAGLISSRSGHRASSSTCTNSLLHGAAAAAAAASTTAHLGPGAQAAASGRLGRDREATAKAAAAAAAAAAMASVLGPEVIVPEQFPEALIRLACVRYRWGVINDVYDWDVDDSSDYSDGDDGVEDACTAEVMPVSPRMNRLAQQQKMQQQQKQESTRKSRPKVLQPEGRGMHRILAPAVALQSTSSNSAAANRSSRSASPGRGRAPDYELPTEADDLVGVVKMFLQHEVLKCARRNRLAGSPLGHRRAQSKQPNVMGWEQLPHGVTRD